MQKKLRRNVDIHSDPEKATVFIIPFDLGVHSYIDHLTGKPRLASPHGWAAGYFLINGSKDKVCWCALPVLDLSTLHHKVLSD